MKYAALLGISVVSSIWSGFVLMTLWTWFIVPTFDMPGLTLPAAIGFGLVVSFLTRQYVSTSEDEYIQMISFSLASPLVALIMGFVVSLFM